RRPRVAPSTGARARPAVPLHGRGRPRAGARGDRVGPRRRRGRRAMTRLAALDLGSNSFHLLVADRRPRGRIKRVTTRKIALRLGDPVTRTGALGETAYARAMAALRELVADAADHGAEQVVAVATEALRVAADGAAFRAEVLRDLRIPIQLLTGL